MAAGSFELIQVPEREVIGAGGNARRVIAFEIARRPVTVEQFLRFSRETGYQSDAERAGGYHYAANEVLDEMGWSAYKDTPAPLMSLHDALAFCEYYALRLPTDLEWLAASVVDWSRTLGGRARVLAMREAMKSPGALREIGLEWVLDEDSSAHHLRSAPAYVLPENWLAKSHPLKAASNFFAHTSCFRVARTR